MWGSLMLLKKVYLINFSFDIDSILLLYVSHSVDNIHESAFPILYESLGL